MEKQLNMQEQGGPPISQLQEDAQILNKMPLEKLNDFVEWVTRHRVLKNVYLEAEYAQFATQFGFAAVSEFESAGRFVDFIFLRGGSLPILDTISDLEKLNVEKEKIDKIIESMKVAWSKYTEFLDDVRLEAVPVLTALNWRIDLRLSSSDFLGQRPDIIALLRIGTSDGRNKKELVVELSRQDFSRIENTIAKMRKEILAAESYLETVKK